MLCARRGATYKTISSANPSATFDPSAANSDSPICPAITEINATPIAAAVNSAEKKTNRKDFFLGKKGAIVVGWWGLGGGGWEAMWQRSQIPNPQSPSPNP
jgi:hypothetical protein